MRFRNSTQRMKNGKRTLCLLAVLFILLQTGTAAKAAPQTPEDCATFFGGQGNSLTRFQPKNEAHDFCISLEHTIIFPETSKKP